MIHVSHPDPHRERSRRILRQHPEIQQLYGRSPHTVVLAIALVTVQLAMAFAVGTLAPWWAALVLAWVFGAFVNHALFAVIHESCHGMVFKRGTPNRLLVLFANVPMLAPFSVSLAHWHLVHHRRQGQGERDPDLPVEWELRLFRGTLGKWVWHVLFPVVQALRTVGHTDDAPPVDRWLVANVVLQLAVVAALAATLPLVGWLYLVGSLYFLFALHPLFGRFVQEHFVFEGERETSSYYGPLNAISLNFGHHVEHHDFPAVPWHRLPQLRRIAAEHYEGEPHHTSWTGLWLRFLFDSSVQIGNRVTRDVR